MRSSRRGNLLLRNPLARGECAVRILCYKKTGLPIWYKNPSFGISYIKIKQPGGKTMIGIVIALLSGALMSVQGVFNTEVTKGTSMWVSNSWVQFSALVISLEIGRASCRERV